MKSNMQSLGSCHRKRNSIFQPALDRAFGHSDKSSASPESCACLPDKDLTLSLSLSQPREVLLSHPSEDGLKLPMRGCFSDGRQEQERARGRAPRLAVPSSPPRPEERRAWLSPCASSALFQGSPIPQGSHIYKTRVLLLKQGR